VGEVSVGKTVSERVSRQGRRGGECVLMTALHGEWS